MHGRLTLRWTPTRRPKLRRPTDLMVLHAQAKSLGLRVAEGTTINETDNCVNALHQQNVRQAFRYFDGNIGNSVNAVLIRPFVHRLLQATTELVMTHAPEVTSKRRRIAFVMPFVILPFTIEEQRALARQLALKARDGDASDVAVGLSETT